jgi:glycosyltransferase involved in cell wall biosynthesis
VGLKDIQEQEPETKSRVFALMKVLRIIARLNVGGPARHVVWLTAGMKSNEYETVLVAGTVPATEDDMGYFAEQLGVKPLVFPEMSREVSPKDALTVIRLFRFMLRERPDVVHTHTAKAGTVGRLAGLLYRWFTPGLLIGRPRVCRFVHTYHGHIFHSYYGRFKTRVFLQIERALARLITDRIIVVSEQQRREINEVFHVGRAEQFVVIPLGIDTGVYANWRERRALMRAELGAAESDVLVGIVGRLTEIKNHSMFLSAAECYRETMGAANRHRVRFVIVGDGNLRPHLEEQARSLGLGNAISFLGTRNDPENFYPALDIVALTSHNEGTPLTLIEAMANARPVIATAVGGVQDLLGHRVSVGERFTVCERGLSVRSEDPPGLAWGLAALIDDVEGRRNLGERGRLFVIQSYSKERLIKDVSKLYQELVGEGHKAAVLEHGVKGASA